MYSVVLCRSFSLSDTLPRRHAGLKACPHDLENLTSRNHSDVFASVAPVVYDNAVGKHLGKSLFAAAVTLDEPTTTWTIIPC